MKVIRILIYEGPEEWVIRNLEIRILNGVLSLPNGSITEAFLPLNSALSSEVLRMVVPYEQFITEPPETPKNSPKA